MNHAETGYGQIISKALKRRKLKADTRHVEAWMRVRFGVLDHLSRQDFENEVALAVQCIEAGPISASEELAESYGL